MSEWRTPGSRRLGRAVLLLVTGLLVVVGSVLSAGTASASSTSPSNLPAGTLSAGLGAAVSEGQALTVPANPTVGPLFTAGLASGHSCTASVLAVGRGLLLTAAHCLSGSAQGIQFVPGYDGTKADTAPYGVWTVTRAWVPAGWVDGEDEQDDYAILQVGDNVVDGQSTALNDLVGGYSIGIATGGGVAVTVPAYVSGRTTRRSAAPPRPASSRVSRVSAAPAT